jgi:hypothetical protein
MGEVINEALLIESNGLRTTCFIVENIPKDLLYHKTKKLQPLDEYSERLVPCFTLDAQGKKHATGELIDELNFGIEKDGAGSGAYVFSLDTDDSVQALKRVDEYIKNHISDPMLRPNRIPYAQQPGERNSAPKAYSSIIRVQLPKPVSPPVVPTTEQAGAVPVRIKHEYTEEQRAAMRVRMKHARETKLAIVHAVSPEQVPVQVPPQV